jgi:hypothetical protein
MIKVSLSKDAIFSKNANSHCLVACELSLARLKRSFIEKNTIFGDLSLIAVTFLSIILFSSFVLVGGNCVVNRGLLGFAGIVSHNLKIV